jgi:hypothetical protein
VETFAQLLHNEIFVGAASAVVLLACSEVGSRLGLRLHASRDEARKRAVAGVPGAILGLLGLLLGFTFAMAVARYDARRALVLQDANTIGTAYLRSSFLPDARVQPVQDLLRRHTALHIEAFHGWSDAAARADAVARSAELQRELWAHAVAAGREAPGAMVASFVSALNDAFDTESERIAMSQAGIPPTIWVLLLFVAGIGCLSNSYAAAAEGVRSPFSTLVLPLLITVVVLLIFDLMHPRQGLIGQSQQPLLDLQQSIAPRAR